MSSPRCSVCRVFLLFFCSCLLSCRRSLPPSSHTPPLMCVLCLVLSRAAALRRPSVCFFAVPCCRVLCCKPCCAVLPYVVVGCCALCRVLRTGFLCVVLCYAVLLPASLFSGALSVVLSCCVVRIVACCLVLVCVAVCFTVSVTAVLCRVASRLCRLALCFCALVCLVSFCLVPPLAVFCPRALSVTLGCCAFWRCILSCFSAPCALHCLCLALVC